jgi:hypothetical protein
MRMRMLGLGVLATVLVTVSLQSSQPPASSVTTGQARLDCNLIPSLMALAFDTTTKYSKDVRTWLILRRVYETELSSEQQVIDAGIDLSMVYELIPVDIKGTTNFKRLQEYKRSRLQTDLNVGSTLNVQELYTKAMNTPGLEALSDMYRRCLLALAQSGGQLTCESNEVSGVVTLRMNFNPRASDQVPSPRVLTGSTVSNATLRPSRFPNNGVPPVTNIAPFTIEPGGVAMTLYRASPDHPIVFAINTRPQGGACNPGALPPAAMFAVTSQITGTAVQSREVRETYTTTFRHQSCKNIALTNHVFNGCMMTPDAKVLRVELSSNPQNPYATRLNADRYTCYQAQSIVRQVVKTEGGQSNCFEATTGIRECEEPYMNSACMYATSAGTPYTLTAVGAVDDQVTLLPQYDTFSRAQGGVPLMVKYAHSIPAGSTNVTFDYRVTVIDMRSGDGPVVLTRAQPIIGRLSTAFDDASRQLSIVLR